MTDPIQTLTHNYAYALFGSEPPIWDPGGGPDVRTLIYFVGGVRNRTTHDYLNQLLSLYDSESPSLTVKAPMTNERRSLMMASLNQQLYAAGGIVESGGKPVETDVLEQYDSATDTWSTKATMLDAAFDGAMGVLKNASDENRVVLTIGSLSALSNSVGGTLHCWDYDPVADVWTKRASRKTHGMAHPAHFTVDNELHLAWGGRGWGSRWDRDHAGIYDYKVANGYLKFHDSYSLETDTWTYSLASPNSNTHDEYQYFPMADARWGAAGFAWNGEGHVCGGLALIAGRLKIKKDVSSFSADENSWSTRQAMTQYRYGHCAVGGGANAYVAGGAGGETDETGVNAFIEDIPRYNDDGWSHCVSLAGSQTMIYAAAGMADVTVEGVAPRRGFVAAGTWYTNIDSVFRDGAPYAFSDLHEYNEANALWIARDGFGAIPENRRYACAGAGSRSLGRGYVIGGVEVGNWGRNETWDLMEYDQSGDWSSLRYAPYIAAYIAAAFSEVIGKLVAANGGDKDGSSAYDTVAQYDPGTDSWATMTAHAGQVGARLVDLGNDMLFIGGSSKNPPTTCERYTPSTDTWAGAANLNSDMQFCVTMKIGIVAGLVYAGAGNIMAANLGNPAPIEKYDIDGNTWAYCANFLSPARTHAGGFGVNKVGVVVGGEYETLGVLNFLGDTHEFDPTTETWAAQTAPIYNYLSRPASFVI